MRTFAELLMSGMKVNIDDYIDAWHDGEGQGLALHEYLGLMDFEYAEWVQTGEFPKRLTP